MRLTTLIRKLEKRARLHLNPCTLMTCFDMKLEAEKNRVTRLLLNIYEKLKFKFSNLPFALCLVKKVSCAVSSFRKNVSKIISKIE